MPCYHPLSGYWSAVANPNGKRSVVFSVSKADVSKGIVQVPCGRCIGCRLERISVFFLGLLLWFIRRMSMPRLCVAGSVCNMLK